MKTFKLTLSTIVLTAAINTNAVSIDANSIQCGKETVCSIQKVVEDFNFLKSKKVSKNNLKNYANKTGQGLVIAGTTTFLVSLAHQAITKMPVSNYGALRINAFFVTGLGGFIMLMTHSDNLADGTMTSYLATDDGLVLLMKLDSSDMLNQAKVNYIIAEKIVSLSNLIRVYEEKNN